MPLFLIFLIISLIEITLFVVVGDLIGVPLTLLLCVLTALIGSYHVRTQGFEVFNRARNSLAKNKMPLPELYHGLCLALAGVMLITPGFLTDMIGFTLLVPAFRNGMKNAVIAKLNIKQASAGGHNQRSQGRDNDIIDDVEYTHVDEHNDKT